MPQNWFQAYKEANPNLFGVDSDFSDSDSENEEIEETQENPENEEADEVTDNEAIKSSLHSFIIFLLNQSELYSGKDQLENEREKKIKKFFSEKKFFSS